MIHRRDETSLTTEPVDFLLYYVFYQLAGAQFMTAVALGNYVFSFFPVWVI